jgi:pyrroline-5-carboxylate reductase
MSKGGTTEAAFTVFDKENTNEGFKKGVQRALARAEELGAG